MLKQEDLIKTSEFWLETIQNQIFREVKNYMETQNLNQTQLAQKLGVSKGYISQILKGNFNFTLKKLIDLALSINILPDLQFTNADKYLETKNKTISEFENIDLINPNFDKIRAEKMETFNNESMVYILRK